MGHSGMSNAAECLRFMIYTINLLMLICCFALIIACGVLLGKHEQLMELLGENTAWVVITAIMATAVIIFLVSLLGCCGAMKENTCMLKTYIGIMFTLLLILLVVAGLGYGYKDPARQTVYDHMEKKMMEYNPLTNSTITRFWDDMQSQVECCGIDNSTDWSVYCSSYINSTSDLMFPKSCLPQGSSDEAYPLGCLDKVEDLLHSNIWIIVGIVAGCAAAMVLAMCCVCRLVRIINQYEQFDDPNNQPLPWMN